MTSIRGLLALLVLAASAVELRAQVVFVPNPYVGNGLYFSRYGRHSSLSFSLGAYNVAPAYFYGAPGYNAINQVTIVYTPQLAPPACDKGDGGFVARVLLERPHDYVARRARLRERHTPLRRTYIRGHDATDKTIGSTRGPL